MGFNIKINEKKIDISESIEGQYKSFDDVCSEIINYSDKHAIDNIALEINGCSHEIKGGLDRFYDRPTYKALVDQINNNLAKEISVTELADLVTQAQETGDYSVLPSSKIIELSADVVLTTSMFVAQREIDYEIDVLTAECAYGMNLFRDLFAGVRDVVGGRSKATEKVLQDGREAAMSELRKSALLACADAVIAIDLDYVELSGGGKSGILLVVATGTAVKLKDRELSIA